MDEMLPLHKFAEDDVERDTRSHQWRFPIVSSPYTRWNYITSVVVNDRLWFGQSPTDEELHIVASFHEQYMDYWYRGGGWVNRMRATYPFDVDGGANGRYLIKHRHGGWGYRHRTWEYGPMFVPAWDEEPVSLVECLDHHFRLGTEHPDTRWIEWKAARPEIFGGEQ